MRCAWRAHAAWLWASGFIIPLFLSLGFSLAFGQKDKPKAGTAQESSIARSLQLKKTEQNIDNFVLELAAASERVEVSASAATITTGGASAPASIVSTAELTALSSAPERVKEILPTAPSIIQTLDGRLHHES